MLRWTCFMAILLLPYFYFTNAKPKYHTNINKHELYEDMARQYEDEYIREYELIKKERLRDEQKDYFRWLTKEIIQNDRNRLKKDSYRQHDQMIGRNEGNREIVISDDDDDDNDDDDDDDKDMQKELKRREKMYASEFGEVQNPLDKKDYFKKDVSMNIDYKKDTVMHQCKNVKPMFQSTSDDIDLLFSVLDRMLNFWDKYYEEIIVDGLFGLRFAEGIAKIGLKKISKEHPLNQRTSQFYEKIKNINNKIYGVLKKRTTPYDQNFLKICDKPFEFVRSWRNVNKSLVVKPTYNKDIDEKESDHCIQLLLGVNKTAGKCHITEKCFKKETIPETKSYLLTHQALYFIAGEVNDCRDKFAKKLGGIDKLEVLYDTFASNTYAQFLETDTKNSFRHYKWDIGSEQAMIGGTLGVVESARIDYIRDALNRWIAPEGCVYEKKKDDTFIEKRVDSEIGRCSQHSTSVAIGYFSVFLNFLINPPPCEMIS